MKLLEMVYWPVLSSVLSRHRDCCLVSVLARPSEIQTHVDVADSGSGGTRKGIPCSGSGGCGTPRSGSSNGQECSRRPLPGVVMLCNVGGSMSGGGGGGGKVKFAPPHDMLKALQQHLQASAPLNGDQAASRSSGLHNGDVAAAAGSAPGDGPVPSRALPAGSSAALPQPAARCTSVQHSWQVGSQQATPAVMRRGGSLPAPRRQGENSSPDSAKCSFPAAAAGVCQQTGGIDSAPAEAADAGHQADGGSGNSAVGGGGSGGGGGPPAEPQHSGNTSGIFDGLYDLEDNWAL